MSVRRSLGSRGVGALRNRATECLEDAAAHHVGLEIVFGVPLHTDGKTPRVRGAHGLDQTVRCDGFGDETWREPVDALVVQRVYGQLGGARNSV